jgi:hypothetical protein
MLTASSGRPEDTVLRFLAPPTRSQRRVDVLLGVSRRRRLAAYTSIAAGFVILRPLVVRVGLLGITLTVFVASVR